MNNTFWQTLDFLSKYHAILRHDGDYFNFTNKCYLHELYLLSLLLISFTKLNYMASIFLKYGTFNHPSENVRRDDDGTTFCSTQL